jgi:hypothetical protein
MVVVVGGQLLPDVAIGVVSPPLFSESRDPPLATFEPPLLVFIFSVVAA